MFFIISKALLFLLQPLNWVALLVIGGTFARARKCKRVSFGLAIAIGFVSTSPLLMNLAYRAWEVPPIRMDAVTPPYDVAIVLGGFSDSKQEPFDRLHLSDSGTRLTHALQLYHEGRVGKILVTGGSGEVLGKKRPEALRVEHFLGQLHFSKEDLLIESASRNTHENAANSKVLLDRDHSSAKRLLLLTDGVHMRRALRCFEKVGLEVTPFATSRRAEPLWPPTLDKFIMPAPSGFESAAALLREVVGTFVYWLKGYA